MADEGIKTPIGESLVNLVAQGLIETVRGVTSSTWFGPGQPLAPVAPKDQGIRITDYPFAVNLQLGPRSTESGITYDQLRGLADGYDLLRCVIETRKDQVVAMPWSFRLRREQGEEKAQHAERTAKDPRIKALNKMFRYPDTERDWKTWVRAALEEVFVIDALSLAPKYLNNNSIYGLDVINGATIVRKIDADGRTPPPPSVAYQQELKGMPAKDLTTRDLIYKPRNYRAHRIYGFSPVEQIVLTVNMALRRQQSQLSYFTDGNIPEAIAQVPENWTPDDTNRFQAQFDVLAGNLAKRSRLRFVPKLEGLLFTKDKMLMDQFDEWLARIVCFCFSVSAQPFIKMMNRATAQTANEAALTEGLIPILDYISGVLTLVVERYMGYEDIEHSFLEDEEADRLKQAQIDKIYIYCGKVSIDEVRMRDGEKPIGMGPAVMTATGPVPLAPFLEGGPLAEGLPQHTETPEEKKAGADDQHQKQIELIQAKKGDAPAKGTDPDPAKVSKAASKKKNY